MNDIHFPVHLKFNIATLSNDFTAQDADGRVLTYVRQKLLKLKEDVLFYKDDSKTEVLYRIKADRWIDFSAAYSITNSKGEELGKIARKGWRSLWKAKYVVVDQHQTEQFSIEEENGWVKVLDGLFGEIPILGMFTGYLFNPSYAVTTLTGEKVIRLKKTPSFFGRKFEISKLSTTDNDDDERVLLGLMMMILLERYRG